jgi:hypothetical protein
VLVSEFIVKQLYFSNAELNACQQKTFLPWESSSRELFTFSFLFMEILGPKQIKIDLPDEKFQC